jgi:hypothetical protein
MPQTKVERRHIKDGYLDINAGFIKLGRLLPVTPILISPIKIINDVFFIDVQYNA